MSLEVTYGEYKKPQVGVKYQADIWDIATPAKSHMFPHLRKVVAVSCFKDGTDPKRAMDTIAIEFVATGRIDGNTVMWVECTVDGVSRRILVNTPQLKTFEPYFVDGNIIGSVSTELSEWGTWTFSDLEFT